MDLFTKGLVVEGSNRKGVVTLIGGRKYRYVVGSKSLHGRSA